MLRWARPLSSARRPSSFSSPGVGEVGGYCSGSSPSRMRTARLSPIHLARRRPLSWRALDAFDRRRAEEFQRLGEEEVGRGGLLLACPLAVERPGEGRLAAQPVLLRLPDRPFGDERRLALAAERDEGQDARMRLACNRLRPGVVDKLRLRLAADEFGRRVAVDAGDVDGGRGGRRERRQRRLLRAAARRPAVAVGVFVPRATFAPSTGLMTAGWPVSSR